MSTQFLISNRNVLNLQYTGLQGYPTTKIFKVKQFIEDEQEKLINVTSNVEKFTTLNISITRSLLKSTLQKKKSSFIEVVLKNVIITPFERTNLITTTTTILHTKKFMVFSKDHKNLKGKIENFLDLQVFNQQVTQDIQEEYPVTPRLLRIIGMKKKREEELEENKAKHKKIEEELSFDLDNLDFPFELNFDSNIEPINDNLKQSSDYNEEDSLNDLLEISLLD